MRSIAYWSVVLVLFLVGVAGVLAGNMFASAYFLLAYVVVALWAGGVSDEKLDA